MKAISPIRVAYDESTDVLFASFGDFDLTCLDYEDDLGNGVFLQYAWPGGDLAGMEIWGFLKHYGVPPITIRAGEFDITVTSLDGELVSV